MNGMRRRTSAIMTDAEVHQPETPISPVIEACHLNDAR